MSENFRGFKPCVFNCVQLLFQLWVISIAPLLLGECWTLVIWWREKKTHTLRRQLLEQTAKLLVDDQKNFDFTKRLKFRTRGSLRYIYIYTIYITIIVRNEAS